jgi:hypothetical protein
VCHPGVDAARFVRHGPPGSLATTHANSAEKAWHQFRQSAHAQPRPDHLVRQIGEQLIFSYTSSGTRGSAASARCWGFVHTSATRNAFRVIRSSRGNMPQPRTKNETNIAPIFSMIPLGITVTSGWIFQRRCHAFVPRNPGAKALRRARVFSA